MNQTGRFSFVLNIHSSNWPISILHKLNNINTNKRTYEQFNTLWAVVAIVIVIVGGGDGGARS